VARNGCAKNGTGDHGRPIEAQPALGIDFDWGWASRSNRGRNSLFLLILILGAGPYARAGERLYFLRANVSLNEEPQIAVTNRRAARH